MNDHEITRMLERLAETFPDRPTPLPDLMAAARAGQRRRIRSMLVAVAASVALVLAGGVVAQQVIRGDDTKPSPNEVADPPTAPEGERLAGMGRVVVSVPAEWGTQDVHCSGQPRANTAFFGVGGPVCLSDFGQRGIASVGFLELGSAAGQIAAASATEPADVDGVEVLRGPTCPDTGECVPPPWSQILVVPSEQVVVVVPQGGEDADVLATVQLLPEGFTTVPYLPTDLANGPAGNLLIAAGLKVQDSPESEIGSGRRPQYGTVPSAGSVVPVGSTITLLLEQPNDSLTDTQAAAAARIARSYIDDNSDWNVTSAWARWETGTVDQPNVGKCRSGELLQVSLLGTFPIPTSGPPPNLSSTPAESDPLADVVTEVQLTADAQSEEVCLLGVAKGTREPDPRATLVYDAASDVVSEPPPGATTSIALGQVVIEVPSSWVSDPNGCDDFISGDVYVRAPGQDKGSCGQFLPAVRLLPTATLEGRQLVRSSPLEDNEVNDITVRMGSSCPPTAGCIYPYGTVVEVPEAGVVVLVTNADQDGAATQAVIDSLQLADPDSVASASDLEGNWQIVSMSRFGALDGAGITDETLAPDSLLMTFTTDTWRASPGGCYFFGGGYTLSSSAFAYRDPGTSSGSNCPDGPQKDELTNVANLMMRVTSAHLHGNVLTLRSEDLTTIMTLERRA